MRRLGVALSVGLIWAVVAAAIQVVSDFIVLRLPVDVSPSGWPTWAPWPRTLLTAFLFAAAGVAFVVLARKLGLSTTRIVAIMVLSMFVMWAAAAVGSLPYLSEFGVVSAIGRMRYTAPVRLAGTIGSLAGASLLIWADRRGSVGMQVNA